MCRAGRCFSYGSSRQELYALDVSLLTCFLLFLFLFTRESGRWIALTGERMRIAHGLLILYSYSPLRESDEVRSIYLLN